MAVINTETFFGRSPSSGTTPTTGPTVSGGAGNGIDVQPSSNPGNEEKKTILSELIQIDKDVKKIQKLITKGRILKKKEEENNKKQDENKKREEKELRLEEKKENILPDIKPTPFPKMGFLDRIKQFLFYTLLGSAFVNFGKHIPEILKFTKLLAPAFKFFEELTGNILNGLVDFIGAGYKAQDKIKEITKAVGGENLEKKFNEFNRQFNTFANLAIVAGLAATGSGIDFGGGEKRERLGVDKQTGRRVSKRSQARFLERYGEKAYVEKFGKRSYKGLTGKTAGRLTGRFAGKALGKIPIIGGLVDFIISTVIFKEKPGRAAAKALGATIGSALGTFVPIPLAGTILGGILGDLVGGALYDSLVSDDKLKGKAKGGQVTRGGKKVGGAVKRTIKKVKSKPTKITPQKSIPGRDIGGKKQIEKLFPTSSDPRKKNPLGVLENTSRDLKRIPLLGGLMGASIDLVMGQRPDENAFKKIGTGFGYLIQSAIDAETTASISNIQRQIVGLAGGGMIPRTLSTNESVGMKIGERIAKTLQTMVNSKVTNTLQAIRQQLNMQDIYGGAGTPDGAPPGEVPPAEISEDQRKASGDLIKYFEKLYGKNAAIGIVANLLRESGLRTKTPDNTRFEGMAQWSRNDRWPKFVSWAQSKGKDPYSRSAQAEWIAIELKQSGTDARLKKAESADAAASIFYNEFERAAYSKPILGNRYNPDNPHERKNRAFVSSLMGGSSTAPPAMVTGGKTPSSIPLTSGQGWRWGKIHKGIDLDGGDGAPISSAQDAKVIFAGDKGDNYGNSVILRYSNGAETRFAHLKSMNVRSGQSIKAGQMIGRQGSTGSSTASHLHFEYYPRGGAMTYEGYGNAASVMDNYFRYGGNVKPKPLQKPADPAGTPPKPSTPSQAKPDTRAPSPTPATVRTKPTRQNWNPSQYGLRQDPKTGVWQKASIAPQNIPKMASGLEQQTTYEVAGGSTLAVQKIIIEKPVPMQMASGSPTIIDNTQPTSTTAALSIA